MITLLNNIISLMQFILPISLSATVILGVILLAKAIAGQRISMKNHALIWLVYIVVLIIPFSLIAENLPAWSSPISQIWTPVNEAVAPLSAGSISVLAIDPESNIPVQSSAISDTSVAEPIASDQTTHTASFFAQLDLKQIIWLSLSLVWLVGMIVLSSVYISSYLKTRNRVSKHSQHMDAFWQNQLEGLAKRIGLRQSVELVALPGIYGPFVFGVRHCRIVLPAELIKHLDHPSIELILMHELVHLKHRDHFLRLLQCLLLSIHWFNPTVWLAFRWQQRDSEYYCDESTISLTEVNNRSNYAQILLSTAARPVYAQDSKTKPNSLLTSSFIEINLHKRIKIILQERKTSSVIALAVILIVVLAGCALIPGISGSSTLTHETSESPGAQTDPSMAQASPSVWDLDDFKYDLPIGLSQVSFDYWGENKAKVFLSSRQQIWNPTDEILPWDVAGGMILLDLKGLENSIVISGDRIEVSSPWVNHASIVSDTTHFDKKLGFEMNTVIFEASFDLYTAAQIAQAEDEGHPIADSEQTAEHWIALMTDGNESTIYVFYLNARLYTIYDLINFAQSVTIHKENPTPAPSLPTVDLTLPTNDPTTLVYHGITPGFIYRIDLNGDGTDELVSAAETSDGNITGIEVNDSRIEHLCTRVYLANLDIDDPGIDLVFENAGEYHSGGTYTFYYFDGQAVQTRGTVSSASNDGYGIRSDNQITSTVFDGHGGIATRTRGSILCTWFLEEHWQIDTDGHLALIPEYYSLVDYGLAYPNIGEPKVTTLMDLPLYADPGESKPAMVASQGTTMRLVKSDNKHWVQVRIENHDLAWFKLQAAEEGADANTIQIDSELFPLHTVIDGLFYSG